MTYSHAGGARGVSVVYVHGHRTRQIERYIIAFLCLVFFCMSASIGLRVLAGVEQVNLPPSVQRILAATPLLPSAEAATPKSLNAIAIQQAVSAWATKNRGTEGVVVLSNDGGTLATSNEHDTFFMASIYKLYVVYLGYQDIDNGVHSLDEPYLNGWSRGRCLDEAIRNSDSPCAEKLMGEYGRQNIMTKLTAYGLTDTSFKGLTTSAHDVAIVLQRVSAGTDLSQASHSALMASMKGQKYRNGLPKGFNGATTYNKVGFQDEAEYHDVGIIEQPDGRRIIVVALTSHVGVRSIAQLASNLQKTF